MSRVGMEYEMFAGPMAFPAVVKVFLGSTFKAALCRSWEPALSVDNVGSRGGDGVWFTAQGLGNVNHPRAVVRATGAGDRPRKVTWPDNDLCVLKSSWRDSIDLCVLCLEWSTIFCLLKWPLHFIWTLLQTQHDLTRKNFKYLCLIVSFAPNFT